MYLNIKLIKFRWVLVITHIENNDIAIDINDYLDDITVCKCDKMNLDYVSKSNSIRMKKKIMWFIYFENSESLTLKKRYKF